MNCPYCMIAYDPQHWEQCPHCGGDEQEPELELSGVLRTSTVLIAAGKEPCALYRSVEDVPEPLRRTLLECTNGQNSGTIYIADQQGRERIALALRNLPGSRPAHDRALAPVLTRFSAALTQPAAKVSRGRLSFSRIWFALMILAMAAAVVWLVGGRLW